METNNYQLYTPTTTDGYMRIYAPKSDRINFMQVIPMSHEERVKTYMKKMTKKQLAEALATMNELFCPEINPTEPIQANYTLTITPQTKCNGENP